MMQMSFSTSVSDGNVDASINIITLLKCKVVTKADDDVKECKLFSPHLIYWSLISCQYSTLNI